MQAIHDRRESTRFAINWNGECRVGEGYALGCFRDISKHGAFFHPATELLGVSREGVGEVPLLLRPGDTVLITYELLPSGLEVTTSAVVRWVGTGREAFGAGLEFRGERFKS